MILVDVTTGGAVRVEITPYGISFSVLALKPEKSFLGRKQSPSAQSSQSLRSGPGSPSSLASGGEGVRKGHTGRQEESSQAELREEPPSQQTCWEVTLCVSLGRQALFSL